VSVRATAGQCPSIVNDLVTKASALHQTARPLCHRQVDELTIRGPGRRAARLLEYEQGLGDPNALGRDLARYESATPARLRATARAVLGGPRVVIEVNPEPAKDEAKAQAGGKR